MTGDGAHGASLPDIALSGAVARKRFRSGSVNDTPEAQGQSISGIRDADSDTYAASRFGHFGEYMRRKRAKLQIQNAHWEDQDHCKQIFRGLAIYVCPNIHGSHR